VTKAIAGFLNSRILVLQRSMAITKKTGHFLILLVLLSACGPLVPLSYDAQDPHANLRQTIDSPEATITLEHLQPQNGFYIFDLEVINHSSAAIQVAPQAISFYASPGLFARLRNPTDNVDSLSAPNSALAMQRAFGSSSTDIRKIYQQKAKQKEAVSVFLSILTTGLMIYADVKSSQASHKGSWTRKDQQRAAGRDILVNVAIAASQIAKAEASKASEDNYYLPYELFPECSIEPGSSVRGKVFIRFERSYRYARLVVPLTETDYVFDLKRRWAKSPKK
jgi:hypothetical protein